MSALGWLLDNSPWWLWLAGVVVLLAATWSVWRPFWLLMPAPLRAAALAAGAAFLAYLAGRNHGAAGAQTRAREKEQTLADDIRRKGADARARADRDAAAGRLRDNDGWKRDDG
ncbi:hypothetical protein AncyloWKF20_05460 [Ancylobacter sp. WKF20]|uniref:hypothetical protein n=1 Tax=Ancylobacter sp. WKF20 TaxID=3039801 RepID=UPI0024345285|nr:hypothetical protein [Ancylobacter sp. WKF20]WGD31272.1 hypothetical protein AncyloWKF20_05460 [Ancylobacter sp. WKF20]